MSNDLQEQTNSKLKFLRDSSSKINVAIAGLPSHGKSEFLVALQGYVTWPVNVLFLDLPNLNFDESNPDILVQYRYADLLIFVHSLQEGALSEAEINVIQKIKGISLYKDNFEQHLGVVFSFLECLQGDAQKDEQAANILKDAKTKLQLSNDALMKFSNAFFTKQNFREISIKKSGINEIVEFLQNKLVSVKLDKDVRIQAEIEGLEKELASVTAMSESPKPANTYPPLPKPANPPGPSNPPDPPAPTPGPSNPPDPPPPTVGPSNPPDPPPPTVGPSNPPDPPPPTPGPSGPPEEPKTIIETPKTGSSNNKFIIMGVCAAIAIGGFVMFSNGSGDKGKMASAPATKVTTEAKASTYNPKQEKAQPAKNEATSSEGSVPQANGDKVKTDSAQAKGDATREEKVIADAKAKQVATQPKNNQSTQTQVVVPAPKPSQAIDPYEATNVVRSFYQYISSKNYGGAYNLLSSNMRTMSGSAPELGQNWAGYTSCSASDVNIASSGNGQVVVRFTYNSVRNGASRSSKGSATLIIEDGQWKIADLYVR